MRGLLLLLIPGLAAAVPLTVQHQGRLLDAVGGTIEGEHSVSVSLFDGDGSPLWSDTFNSVRFHDGYYALVLGSGVALEASDLAGDDVYVEVGVDGVALPHRTQIHSLPFALRADRASVADHAESAAGRLVVGDVPGQCNGDVTLGTLRFTDGALAVCGAAGWAPVSIANDGSSPASPGTTCRQILRNYPTLPSGTFWISPDGGPAVEVYCDMVTDGGGWTRTAVFRSNDSSWCDNQSAWTFTRRFAAAVPTGGEILSKFHNGTTNVSPVSTPTSVLRLHKGPYSTLSAMFAFSHTANSWVHQGSTAFGLTAISGPQETNVVWWDHGASASNKAEFCLGNNTNTCVYTGHGTVCPTMHYAGTWRSPTAQETYLREP